MVKYLKVLAWFVYGTIFVGLLMLEFWFRLHGSESSVASLGYWMVLMGWLYMLYGFGWGSSVSLYLTFALFLVAVCLTVVGLGGLGETVMRLSFIFWVVGVGQALVEYRKSNVGKSGRAG